MKKKKLIGLCLSFLISVNTTFSQDAECLTFDGTDDYVVADNDALNAIGTGDFTVEAWVNGELAGQNAHPTIFSNRPVSGVGMTFFFHNIWGGSLYKMLSVQLGGINYFVFNNGTYDATFFDGTCHHVAVSREGTTLNFYADGVFFGTREMRVDLTTASVGDLWIGKDLPTNNSYEGNISQLRIWDVVRTADEILDNKDLSIPGDSPNLVGYWELNDGSGQVATDKTGTADGQLGSSPSADGLDPIWGRLCCIAGCEPLTTVVSTTDICIGGEVTLEATSEIGGTITWSDGVENGVPFTIDAEGVYTYIATSDDDADCEFEVEITVHGPPEVVAAVDEEIICLGQSVFFYGLGADTYVWDNDVLDRVEYTPTEVGLMTYTVT
ncbi:LamG domain-containing protein, partial [Crocinitomix catalasitica]|uniref:LamG domain-containing protein n=1 Tax=Crocinitomix catalasitica TaxID=184607 RepID=UPI0005606C42